MNTSNSRKKHRGFQKGGNTQPGCKRHISRKIDWDSISKTKGVGLKNCGPDLGDDSDKEKLVQDHRTSYWQN